MISETDFIFWKYVLEYGVFDERGNVVGVREDAPKEIKQSWEEYQKTEALAREKGLK